MKIALIGFGASGLFALKYLKNSKHDVDVFDVGPEFKKRTPCPRDLGKFTKCPPNGCKYCSVYSSGGIFNDGKLTVNSSPVVGGELYSLIGKELLQNKLDKVLDDFREAGADLPLITPSKDDLDWAISKSTLAGMHFEEVKLIHMGSDRLPQIVQNMYEGIKDRFNYSWETKVENIFLLPDGKFKVTYKDISKNNSEIGEKVYDSVIVSAGRSGSRWFTETDLFSRLDTKAGRVDVGVRLETADEFMKPLTDRFYDFKIYHRSPTFGDMARSFCVNPSGFVCVENNGEFSIVNGHAKRDVKSHNTNFAILVSKTFTEPFKSPVKYANAVASLANMLGGGPIGQRLGDLRKGRRTKKIEFNSIKPTLNATWGDISLALPYRIMTTILEYIAALDKITPGVNCDDTLLYAVEAKYFTDKILTNQNMETMQIPNCYIIGDLGGTTRGISQSSVSGMLAAEQLLNK